MRLSETKKGELAVLSQALLWALFPVITVLSYTTLAPIISLFFSVLLATIFFAVLMTLKHSWGELKQSGIWLDLVYITLLIGVLFYAFYFSGLKYTTPGNASLIALLEFFFSFVFFNVWKKQRLAGKQIGGGLLMVLGATIILLPKTASLFNLGDLLVAAAVFFAPFGNYFQQRLRQKISSETMMFIRSLLTLPCAFLLSLAFKERFSWEAIHGAFWFLLVNGILLLGVTKILWLEGIHRIPVTKAVALESIGPLFTLLFALLLLRQIPTIWQLVAFVPLSLGLVLLTSAKNPPAEVLELNVK